MDRTPDQNKRDLYPAALHGAYSFISSASNFFLPIFFREQLGFSGAQIGALYALQAVTGILASFPAGWGNDRITSRSLVATGLAIQSASFILMALIKPFPFYFVVFFFWAMAFNLYRISMDVQILKTDHGEGFAKRVLTFQAVRFSGLALGTALAGYIIAKFDFRFCLFAMAAACLALTVFARLLHPTPVAKPDLKEYGADIRQPKIILFALWFFAFSLHWGAEMTCYGLFLRNYLHLDMVGLGWYMTGEFGIMSVCFFTLLRYRRVFQRQSIRSIAVTGMLLSALGSFGMLAHPPQLSFAFRMIHGVGDGFILLILYLRVARLFEIERMGGNTGFLNLAAMAGMSCGALIFSPVGDHFGYSIPFIASGILLTLLAVPPMFLKPRV